MGTCTSLISDAAKEHFSLGKLFWDEELVESMKVPGADLPALIRGSFRDDCNDLAAGEPEDEMIERAIAWMTAHPDWRFATEYDDDDDIYLAEDDDDAADYREEFGEDAAVIYAKTGCIFPDEEN